MTKPIRKNQSYIILDSNIIQYLKSDDLSDKILEFIYESTQMKYSISISDITFFELLNGISVKNEGEIIKLFKGITRFFVKKNVLVAAARLGCLYKEDGIDTKKIGVADLIIAGTSVLSNSYVLTANIRDFPNPFFDIELKKVIEYEDKKIPKCLCLAFLKPNSEVIAKYYTQRLSEN